MLACIVAFIFYASENDPQKELLDLIKDWDANFFWIILIILGFTLLCTITGLPVLYLGVALGFLLNYLPALLLAIAMNLVAVMLTYFMVKNLFSEYFKARYGNKKIIKKINSRIKKYGLWTITLSRGVYIIPTSIINFIFPLSKLSTKKYFFGTIIGLIPECTINISMGQLLKHQILLINAHEQNHIKFIVISFFLVLIAFTIVIVNYRRKRIKKSRINEIVPPFKN